MLPTRHLPEFLVTVYVLILIPGPSVLWLGSSPRRLERLTAGAAWR